MHAGLSRARGDIVVTMDGDLQNPPEDIPRLVEAVEAGDDVASGRRAARHDSWGRTLPSRLINGMLRRFTGVDISDFGCAFNAYRRERGRADARRDRASRSSRRRSSSPAARSVVEVDVGHAPRAGRVALLAAAPDAPRAARARRLLAAADPVGRGRARRRLLARLARARRLRARLTGSTNSDFPGPLLARRRWSSPCSASRASSSRSSASTSAESSARSKARPLYSIVGASCETSAFWSPAAPGSSRRTSSGTCSATRITRSSRSTRSPTRATSRTSPT